MLGVRAGEFWKKSGHTGRWQKHQLRQPRKSRGVRRRTFLVVSGGSSVKEDNTRCDRSIG